MNDPTFRAFALALMLAGGALAGTSTTTAEAGIRKGVSMLSDITPLRMEIDRIAGRQDNVIGVSIQHLESGLALSINGAESFPMASTYKVAMAAYALHLVDQGKLSLDQMIPIRQRQLSTSSIITKHFPHPGLAVSLWNLMDLMLRESDNTATDVLLETVGGPAAVTAWLDEIGIHAMRVDRSTAELLRQFAGLPEPSGADVSFNRQYLDMSDKVAMQAYVKDGSSAYYRRYAADPQDQASPDAMTLLLRKIWRDEVLTPQSGKVLRSIMGNCETGQNRLGGRLPAGTPLAHKTGTLAGTINDAGVITLPGKGGHVLITVYIKNGAGEWEGHEAVIADISRAVYDFFLFNGFR